jgi:hypothetical protein
MLHHTSNNRWHYLHNLKVSPFTSVLEKTHEGQKTQLLVPRKDCHLMSFFKTRVPSLTAYSGNKLVQKFLHTIIGLMWNRLGLDLI